MDSRALECVHTRSDFFLKRNSSFLVSETFPFLNWIRRHKTHAFIRPKNAEISSLTGSPFQMKLFIDIRAIERDRFSYIVSPGGLFKFIWRQFLLFSITGFFFIYPKTDSRTSSSFLSFLPRSPAPKNRMKT